MNIITHIQNSTLENVIVAGDFNLTFDNDDRLNRGTCNGEIAVASQLQEKFAELNFVDTWQGHKGMTWRRGGAWSRLDRIFIRLYGFKCENTETDWTMCDSDHAAVITTVKAEYKKMKGPKICRLDPAVVTNPETLSKLRQYLTEQLTTVDVNATPHFRLEFSKMTIRTKAIELSKSLREAESTNLKLINEDIKLHENILNGSCSPGEEADIILHIEQQVNEKNRIIETQGKQLAWKSRTKWYNEGEKSNKYFLNLLKRNNTASQMASIKVGDNYIMNELEINKAVNDYYKELYNSGHVTAEGDNIFFDDLFTLQDHETAVVSAPITLADLWAVLKNLKDSAPGPDGISHTYLKRLWDILGPLILDSWNYSITTKTLPPSYCRSYLRLIPKVGKDTSFLKNWRPITLSNCDLKLITRVYNNRIIAMIGDHISPTQTAYIKGRNITDNIRLINAAIQLANNEPQISGSIIALDAQKAFDSVNHNYIKSVLGKIGLNVFIPIFELLYKNIHNDLVLNGAVVGSHAITNGVKQGDALSCTLFVLAMEPLLRNIEQNERIKSIESVTLQHKWPKVVGYADDITCITCDDLESKQAIFEEYERFTNIAGLKLNADKTEIFIFRGGLHNNDNASLLAPIKVNYMGEEYNITPIKEIKINGVILCKNLNHSKKLNCARLIQKLDQYFKQWSQRNLSLLGKIQIYKTFGLSQFLYHLAVCEPTDVDWKAIHMRVNKFIWNKNYSGNLAPARIKNEVMYTSVNEGGFGMLSIKEVTTSLRLRRHFTLLKYNIHPMSILIRKLTEGTGYLGTKPLLEIDEILGLNLITLHNKRVADYKMPDWNIESDLTLHANLLQTNIIDLVRPRKRASQEAQQLFRRGLKTFADVVRNPIRNLTILSKIADKNMVNAINIVGRTYINMPLPNLNPISKLRDRSGRWCDDTLVSSKGLREIIFDKRNCSPKITVMTDEVKSVYFKNLSRIISVVNKTRMLRLLQGDVYCAERRYRFGMSESDRCHRCFEVETIYHLLTECPYSRKVYSLLGIDNLELNNILGVDLNRFDLEIRADILNYLVFRQHVMPPEVLVQTTLERYANGLAGQGKISRLAKATLDSIEQRIR